MALSREHKAELARLKAELPSDRDLRLRLDRYLAVSGMTDADFAARCGYSRPAIQLFRIGAYDKLSRNDGAAVRAAVKWVMDSQPADLDEKITGAIYKTRNYQILRKYFYRSLEQGAGYHVYGPPATQKSFISQALIGELRESEAGKNGEARFAAYVYCRLNHSPHELLKKIAIEWGVPPRGTIDQVIRKIRMAASGRRAVVVFDEAQHLNFDCIETVRELLDLKPHIGLLFIGSHHLETTFKRFDMEQWRSRMNAGEALPGVSREEALELAVSELGQGYSLKKINGMIDDSLVEDVYKLDEKQRPVKYISMRTLCVAIANVKRAREAKGATA